MRWAIRLVVPRHLVGVCIILFNEHRQVLLLHHVFHPTCPWGIPGGWLNRNEDPADCALRELKEETGLTAVLGPLLLINRKDNPSHLEFAYLAYGATGSLALSNEIIEAAWTNLDALPQLLPFTQEAVEKAANLYDTVGVGENGKII